MATAADVPSRDGKDGAAQLALLRAYLKDRDAGSYKYTDSLLYDILVTAAPVTAWRNLIGAGATAVPFSFDISKLNLPVNRIRAVTEDTTELTLKYTDAELLKLLEAIPLRYVVSLIKAKEADGKTFPTDPDNPLHIMRKYLEDETGAKYTDGQLADLILTTGLNPFQIVMDIMDKAIGSSVHSHVVNTSGTSLAAIDGISFNSPKTEVTESKSSRDIVSEHLTYSIYSRDPVFGFWSAGVNVAAVEWEGEWYAL